MANNSEKNLHHQQGAGDSENGSMDRTEQFNELSELSLEERMNVADQMGVPVESAGEAAATGAMRGADDNAGVSNDRMEEESTREEGGR